MKAVIHIGTEKTGTTTLQELFHTNRAKLAEKGVYYPKTPGNKQHSLLAFYCMKTDRENIHTRSGAFLQGIDRDAWRRRFADDFSKELTKARGRSDTLLVSTELLHSQLAWNSEIARLKWLLDRYCDDYRIVVYLRRQDQLAVSRYSTMLRTGSASRNIFPEADAPIHYFDYASMLESWEKVFGYDRIVPRVFETSGMVDGDLATDFVSASQLAVDAGELRKVRFKNTALSALAQNYLLEHNSCLAAESPDQPVARSHNRKALISFLADSCPGPPRVPAREDAIRFYETYRAGNANVARKWFGRDELFQENFSEYPDHPMEQTLYLEDAMRISSDAMNSLFENSVWLDDIRLQRLLEIRDDSRFIDVLAQYLAEREPELGKRMDSVRERRLQ